jgi:hypothetical protein
MYTISGDPFHPYAEEGNRIEFHKAHIWNADYSCHAEKRKRRKRE